MRFITIAGVCAALAAAITITTTPASYADISSSSFEKALLTPLPASAQTTSASEGSLFDKEVAVLTRKGISTARALQAIHVQGAIAQADLVRKVETAMAGEFAGVWFEPAAARLQIGTTSSESRRAAERAAAQTGLANDVAVTPVRSTMAQLLATQRQWNHKLRRLFTREEVETGLEPQRNAVAVRLSSSVSARERTAIEREAAAAGTNVSVTIAGAKLSLVQQAKTECKEFARNEAYCDPSITSSVRIQEKNANGCTAGPIGIPLANRLERVLLTAGHCIENGGGVGEKWRAFNKAGVESVVGPAQAFTNGGAEGAKKGDYGSILIEPAWQTGKVNNPVFAVTAEWKKMAEKKEKTSYPVKGERAPVVKNTNCHEGQTSGETCGEITLLNVTLVIGAKFIEGLVEDSGENLLGEGGDSGGPWLFIEANQEALMEGLHEGFVPECVKLAEVKKGPKFFKTQAECSSLGFKEMEGNEGAWERKEYECVKVVGVKEGAKFYGTEAECKNLEKAGKGEWERKPKMHLVFQPLKQPVAGAAEGALEALKLELLTTANEVIPRRWEVNGTLLTGTAALLNSATVLAHGELVAAGVKVTCTGTTVGITSGELVAPNEVRAKDLTFSNCAATAPCSLASETILTLAIHGFAHLDGTLNTLILTLPLPSKTFAVIKFEGEVCALLGAQPVTGTADVLIHGGADAAVSHLILAFSLTGSLKLGSSAATLSGFDGDLRLASGQTWNYL
jgi:hypothetical protein